MRIIHVRAKLFIMCELEKNNGNWGLLGDADCIWGVQWALGCLAQLPWKLGVEETNRPSDLSASGFLLFVNESLQTFQLIGLYRRW